MSRASEYAAALAQARDQLQTVKNSRPPLFEVAGLRAEVTQGGEASLTLLNSYEASGAQASLGLTPDALLELAYWAIEQFEDRPLVRWSDNGSPNAQGEDRLRWQALSRLAALGGMTLRNRAPGPTEPPPGFGELAPEPGRRPKRGKPS